MLEPNDVFTPGRLPIRPSNVYANRGKAEESFDKAIRRGFIPVVFGEYGVGKTSMARYSLRETDAMNRLVNVESVAQKSLADVVSRILERLGYTVRTKTISAQEKRAVHQQEGSAKVGVPWLKGLVASRRTTEEGTSQTLEEELVVTSPTDSRVIELCEQHRLVLLLDELHRSSDEFADELAMFLKAYGNANCQAFSVVLLGTSSDATRLVRSDPGIDRLLHEVRLGAMTDEESRFVVGRGMHDLSIQIDDSTVDSLVRMSVGSPSILQYLCLEVAEAAFQRTPRTVLESDVPRALDEYVANKEARLYRMYMAGIETVGDLRYRKQILRAMAEADDEYVTMEDIRTSVSTYLGRDVPSTALSGPLRDLKEQKYGPLLGDVDRPDGAGRVQNYTTFVDPALKAFIRMLVLREREGDSH